MRNIGVKTLAAAVILATPAAAEMEVSFYIGSQSSPHSTLTGDFAGTPVDRTIKGEGKALPAPPH